MKKKNYQDYVIKNGKFIGEFEKCYQDFNDPWHHLKINNKPNLKLKIIKHFCDQIQKNKKKNIKILEIGCGFAHISNYLIKNNKFKYYGTDISTTAIYKAKKMFPKLKKNLFVNEFSNYQLYKKINPDIFLLSEIAWYILPDIKKFLKYVKLNHKNSYLINCLTLYDRNIQKYGNNYFSNNEELIKFFNLNLIISTIIKKKGSNSSLSIFLAKLSNKRSKDNKNEIL